MREVKANLTAEKTVRFDPRTFIDLLFPGIEYFFQEIKILVLEMAFHTIFWRLFFSWPIRNVSNCLLQNAPLFCSCAPAAMRAWRMLSALFPCRGVGLSGYCSGWLSRT